MSTGGILLAGGAALLVFWGIGAYNRLVRLRSAVMQAWGPVDVQLGRRHALARDLSALLGAPEAEPVLGDPVGRAARQTLQAAATQAATAAAHARSRATVAGALQSLALAEQVLNGALRPLPLLIAARTEGLQTSPEWLPKVQALLQTHREQQPQLVFVRRAFNEAVGALNTAIEEMPTCLLAGPMGFRAAAALHEPEPGAVPVADASGSG